MIPFPLTLKHWLLLVGFLSLPIFAYVLWQTMGEEQTLSTLTDSYQQAGTEVRQDLETLAPQAITEEEQIYTITDTTSDGIDIKFANEASTSSAPGGTPTLSEDPLGSSTSKSPLTLSFPKDYSQPIEVKLDDKRTITITDLGGKSDYQASTISATTPDSLRGEASKSVSSVIPGTDPESRTWFQKLLNNLDPRGKPEDDQFGRTESLSGETAKYLRYTSKDQRKELLYAYQKDQATGEKKLKHWTLYQEGNGVEQESYQIENAKIKVTEEGRAEVFYYGDQDLKNDQAATEVDSNLLERAQRTLAKEMGDDLLSGSHTPDLTIPKPYYIDKNGEKHDAEWKWSEETSTLSVSFTPESYPVALDPTLSFTAPGVSNSGSVMTGEAASSVFGSAMVAGDWNADGKTDLAVSAYQYSTNTGRVYIFYNDGFLSTTASGADVIVTGETTSSYFGYSLASGDYNADGKTDLAVGAWAYSTAAGRAYLFYGGSIITENASGADVILTGETTSNYFGYSLASGDYNADGKTDLAVSAYSYSTSAGRAYIFYNGSIITENASGADVIITGEISSDFGISLISGDYNADGKTDLAVGADRWNNNFTGRAYIFYNGSIITEAATGADIIITGETTNNWFGSFLASGDYNADGKTDLAVSAYNYSTSAGRAYIFYSGSIITENASGADVKITGETSSYFGYSLASGDYNADGRTDLAVSAAGYSSITGRAYILYNDGSIPTTAATADVIITGERAGNNFGLSLASGDFNADGKTDLAVGAATYAGNRGRAYIFYSQNGQVNTNQAITGETTSNYFGSAMTTGDFNADGRTDLAVGANTYSTSTGRTYIFYGDGTTPTTAATADVIITGEASSSQFGASLAAGDFNADGTMDLVVGASGTFPTLGGKVYIFYNDGSIPTTAATADVTITDEGILNFGLSLTAGDFNADGKTDVVVSAVTWSSNKGRAYIFYNDGSIPTTATTADVIISGEASGSDFFGYSLASGDFNADGKIDLAVGAVRYFTNTGRSYIFYNDGTIPTTAATADITITGEATNNYFGSSLAAGDFNADGKTDLAVGAYGYSTNTGRAYLFYGGSIITEAASGADVVLTGEASSQFGTPLVAGDFNADGRTDLAVGASAITTNTGKAYLFYNDGSYPSTAATADVTITGETTSNYFGYALATGDMNGDGRTDLVVGAYGHTTSTGKVYIYETRENFAWEIQEQFGGASRTGVNGTGQELQITGETGSYFGTAMTTGDYNADGKTDLAVGAYAYSTNTGRVYIFYGDGSLTVGASSADIILTGEATTNYFGTSLASGDWNADGQIDLAVGAEGYSTYTGRAYIFYGGSIVSENASDADIILTGTGIVDLFGHSLIPGDFNADGKTDLAVGGQGYSTGGWTGRVYLFYNGSITTENASGADAIITGETTSNYFGVSLSAGDFNADGKTDLAVGASGYSSQTGRAYIFYNGSIITENASGADVIITGETTSNYFGYSLASGDFNADGKTDLAVGATGYSTDTGRAYIFYSGSIITENASGADVILTGETTSNRFGASLAAGDFNADGRTDLAVGAYGYSTSTGRAYVFYNDGSIPTTAATADIILTGETTSNYFGASLAAGDFNADGKTDLAVGAYGYASNKGKVYIYTFNDPIITGETTSNYFGHSLASGDYNADGRTDLAVGAYGYSADTGRAYLFYGGSIITENASAADVIITGEASSRFGDSLLAGDFNADGKIDLVVGASNYSTSTGRAYIFYTDGTIPTTAATADVIITGEATTDYFSSSLASGDWNADGQPDLAVGAYSYNSSVDGRAYIFYADGTIPITAATADVIITGRVNGGEFGVSLASGDFNTDGKTDLAVGDLRDGSGVSYGSVYLFYNDGSIPTTAATADVIIGGDTADTGGAFGRSGMTAGDFNTDGRIDLAVGASGYSTSTGRAYIFYNDGTYPASAASADVTIIGEATNNYFGGNDRHGGMIASDWNADGKTDLAVVASGYDLPNTNAGRVYLFYNDGSIPTTAAAADVIISGEASSNFGDSLAVGDFNVDGKTDLAVGAWGYSTNTGRVYLYTSEVSAASTPPGTATLKGGGTLKGTGKLK